MRKILLCLVAIGLFSISVLGQSTASLPAFEAADVHPTPPTTVPIMTGGALRGGRYVGNPALTQSYSCQNTTLAQLASQIRGWAPAYFDHQVIDTTGLEGSWDFVLSWTPKALALGTGNRGDAPGDPNGGLTIFEAADRQLG